MMDDTTNIIQLPTKIKITHVIFDLDGLLLDTEFMYEKATQRIVQRYGKTFTLEKKLKFLGRSGSDIAQLLIDDLHLPLTVREFMQEFDVEYKRLVEEQPVPLMPNAERLIRHLYQVKIPIAIATSSRRLIYDLNVKYHHVLFSLFNHVLLSSDDPEVTRGKPDPEPFLVCAKRFSKLPKTNQNVLVFEDSLVGIESANRAGMTTIWVPDNRFNQTKMQGTFSSISKPFLTLQSLKLFQPELFGLPAFSEETK